MRIRCVKRRKYKKLNEKYKSDKANKVRHRLLNKVPLIDLITDNDTKLDVEFNIDIKTHSITDQKATGRCWAFAGLNILRKKVISECNLVNFELSASYVAFYDKLEKFNITLERLITYKDNNKDLYERDIDDLLSCPIGDGGYFFRLANLIKKYGIVPKNSYPETFASSNTSELNEILARLIRKFYLELENSKSVNKLKEKYLEEAYGIMANLYDLPPKKFDFEYTNKMGEYHLDKDLTPLQFYEKYINIDLVNDYVEVSCYHDNRITYNNLYEIENSNMISGNKDNFILNVSPKELKKLMIKQIKDKEPVYFYCSTSSKLIDGIWIDILDRYGEIFDTDLSLDNTSILKTNGITNAHCMLMTGVNIVDDTPTKWKVQNSWGGKRGNKGYYIACDDWVNKYVFRIVINKKYLSKKYLEILESKPVKIDKYSIKF